MTFFGRVSEVLGDAFGIDLGVIGVSTKVVGLFGAFMLMMLGVILIGLGYVSYRSKSYPKWIGTFAMGAVSVSLLLWVLIPGFPVASTIGLLVGLAGAVVTFLVYRSGVLSGENSAKVCVGLGIASAVMGIIVVLIELYGGGGFLV